MDKLPPQVLQDAKLVYNYHRMKMPLLQPPADAIFCLCSLDTRIAAYTAQLWLDGLAPRIIFSGDSGALTEGLFGAQSEAEAFADVARGMGVPDEVMIIEPRARNTGENVRFTYALLQEKGLLADFKALILVQKPYMERRTYATFKKQWPDAATTEFCVTSPPVEFEQYPDGEINPVELVISIMIGDLVRIREYPARGFQIPQEMPESVAQAGERLIAAGYNKHLP